MRIGGKTLARFPRLNSIDMFKSNKEYAVYIKSCSYQGLLSILRHMDITKNPIRYNMVIEEINKRQNEREIKRPKKVISTGPFENLNPAKWPFNDIILGISLPVFIIIYNIFEGYLTAFFSPVSGFIFFITIFILSSAIMLIYPIYTCKKRQFWPLFSFTNIENILKEIGTSFLYWLLIGIILGLILGIIKIALNIPDQQSFLVRFVSNIPNSAILVVIILYVSILGPIIEEIFFRGFLYNSMKTHFPVWMAMIFQAAFFSMVHDPNDLMHMFYTFLMGVALALAYESRGTLLSPIFIHIIANSGWSIRVIMAR